MYAWFMVATKKVFHKIVWFMLMNFSDDVIWYMFYWVDLFGNAYFLKETTENISCYYNVVRVSMQTSTVSFNDHRYRIRLLFYMNRLCFDSIRYNEVLQYYLYHTKQYATDMSSSSRIYLTIQVDEYNNLTNKVNGWCSILCMIGVHDMQMNCEYIPYSYVSTFDKNDIKKFNKIIQFNTVDFSCVECKLKYQETQKEDLDLTKLEEIASGKV